MDVETIGDEVAATLRELDIVPVTTPATADSLQAMAEVYESAGSK